MSVKIQLDEGQRQMVLMALSHLAVERPDWKRALEHIACMIDTTRITELGVRPVVFNQLYWMHKEEIDHKKPPELKKGTRVIRKSS